VIGAGVAVLWLGYALAFWGATFLFAKTGGGKKTGGGSGQPTISKTTSAFHPKQAVAPTAGKVTTPHVRALGSGNRGR